MNSKSAPPEVTGVQEDFRKEVAERARNQTPAAYMQVVGIVQSIALSYLAYLAAKAVYEDGFNPFTLDAALWWVKNLASFLLIVLTWHVNTQNVMAIKRHHTFQDSLIPFLFAWPQYFIAVACEPQRDFWDWAFAIAFFALIAAYALVDLWREVGSRDDNPRHNQDIFAATRWYFRLIWVYVLFVGSLAAYFGWSALSSQGDSVGGPIRVLPIDLPEWMMAAVLLALMFGYAAMHANLFWKVVKARASI